LDGFSSDGYIIDQDRFSDYRYRGITSDINGCGWIAAYNLRHAAGQEPDFDEVRREMNAMFPLQIPGPTPVRKLRRYLKRYLRYGFAAGKRRALAAAKAGDAGILRYWEEKTPHFVSFVRQEDGTFRFFNVADGMEDLRAPMDRFFSEHCHKGLLRVLVWKKKDVPTE